MEITEATRVMKAHGWRQGNGGRLATSWHPGSTVWERLRKMKLRAEHNRHSGNVTITIVCQSKEELEIVLQELGT